MGLGRRSVGLHDPSGWVFNRMAEVYDARPAYPPVLVDALAGSVAGGRRKVADVGAGIGHLAVPLAARGFDVTAIEPAGAMLARLREAAAAEGATLEAVHATAEALPLPDASVDLVIIADALHFLDAELSAREIGRVLAAGGALAILTCALADTPFMRAVTTIMQDAAPRRPRDVTGTLRQVATVAGVAPEAVLRFDDETVVDAQGLERILRSISFIGPAMNAERFAAFRERVHAVPGPRAWARELTLRLYRRRR